MPHFAFCLNCGNRMAIPSADAVRKYCNLCATPEGRKQQKDEQAKLERERQEQQHS
jgi:hypothetical protein